LTSREIWYKKIIMMSETEKQPSLRFGAVLRRHRQGAGLTITQLALRIGRTQSYVSQLESGALHPPDDDMLSKIARVLGTDEERLIIEAGRLPEPYRKLALEWAKHDLSGFKHSVTASAANYFDLNDRDSNSHRSEGDDVASDSKASRGAEE
jgi:transcriptional regulator with XRE-family HTH domain